MTKIINARLQGGLWSAELAGEGSGQPRLTAAFAGQDLPDPEMQFDSARDIWRVTVSLPPEMIGEGVQALLIRDVSGATLASVTITAGEVLEDDLRAEVALLRAELDLLKSAFRKSQRDS
ncbi:MAG: hypothetical protein AAFU41_07335 [Pseudomonadota bacterium]